MEDQQLEDWEKQLLAQTPVLDLSDPKQAKEALEDWEWWP